MENIINLLSKIDINSIKSSKDNIEKFFFLIFKELVEKSTPEFDRQKDQLAYSISKLLKSEIQSELVLVEIKKRLSFSRSRNDYDEIIVNSLVSAGTVDSILILNDFLKSESFVLKAYIFYHRTSYPIPKIVQTSEFKISIVDFINSDQFLSIYEERCNWPGYHSESFAFPGHYISCFNIKEFDEIKLEKYSTSKLSKLITKERLESIKLINNPFFKMELIQRYFYCLPTLYKTKFVRLVDKTFPELELEKNGHSVYSRYL